MYITIVMYYTQVSFKYHCIDSLKWQTFTETCRRKREILLYVLDVPILVLKMRNSVLYFMYDVECSILFQKCRN